MSNYEIAERFELLAKLIDLHGQNSFKAKSYASAAFALEKLPKEVELMDDKELFQQRGIGQSVGEKIRELLADGQMRALQDLLEATPDGVLDLMELKGLGPKKIAVIWKELGVESIGELEYACNENRLVALKGFGQKTQESISRQIAFRRQSAGYHLWAEVEPLAQTLLTQLQKVFPQERFALTGAIRRQEPTLEFIEIASTLEQDDLIRGYENLEGVTLQTTPANQLTVKLPDHPALKFHLSDRKNFHRNLFCSTGSEVFIQAFDTGFKMPDEPAAESEIFSENGLAFIPPPLRETAAILEKAAADELPEILTEREIRGIIHSHSKWSDGAETIEIMARAALQQGFEYLVLSDHSQAAYYAQGLKPEQVIAQHAEIDALNRQLAPFHIFKSIEADILNDGSLDYNAEILATFDLVIASVHSNIRMSLDKAMERLLNAIRNPFTNILGHMTGRLLLSREGYPVEHKTIIDACASNNVVIEINAHPRRLDMDWRWIGYALDQGVLLSIDPDAHALSGYRDVYYGVMAAQKGGLTARQNLSSFSLAEFEEWLAVQQQKRLG